MEHSGLGPHCLLQHGCMRGSRKFCQRVTNSTLTKFFFVLLFFLVDEGRKAPNFTLSGASSAHQHWCAEVGPTLNVG